MEFSLVAGQTVLARISAVEPDMPWLEGHLTPTADFETVRPMFIRAGELLEQESWVEWERLWAAVRQAGIRLRRIDEPEEIIEFALYVEGDPVPLQVPAVGRCLTPRGYRTRCWT